MIYSTPGGRLRWSLRKNVPDLTALALRRYPKFVLRDTSDIGDLIPVFVYHSVEPRTFEQDCLRLVEGGYRTLAADEFEAILAGRHAAPLRSVVLTFDDGGGSSWAVAYPLLEKYALKGIAFVVSGLVSSDEVYRPSMKDVWSGAGDLDEVLNRERGEVPMCTWSELARMQSSGTMDVQSHTHTHSLVHVGPRIRDFLNPGTDPYLIGNFNIPVVREGSSDRIDRPLRLGRPVYEALPRLAGRLRYLDDENARQECEAFVEARGGAAFFERRGWRRDLRRVARRATSGAEYESAEDLEAAISAELATSRSAIEERVGNRVRHLCFPWYEGSRLAVDLARRSGFEAAYWGVTESPNAVRPNGDPLHIPRIDGRYVARLPGPRRVPLATILRSHFAGRFQRSALDK